MDIAIRKKSIGKVSFYVFLYVLLLFGRSDKLSAQRSLQSLVSTPREHFVAKLDNPFWVVAQQNTPVKLEQLSATLQAYNQESKPIEIREAYGSFIIRPDTIGIIEIRIHLKDTTETKLFRVKPVKATGRLSRHTANSDEKIKVGEFRAQQGIIAAIENYDIQANCKIYGFETIRISRWDEVERSINTGARFDEDTSKVIEHATPGDLFIFRNIRYRCPGDSKIQQLEDMIFELE